MNSNKNYIKSIHKIYRNRKQNNPVYIKYEDFINKIVELKEGLKK